MIGFIEVPSVGVIEFEGDVVVDDSNDRLYRRTTVTIDRAWFKDTRLSIPKSEFSWIIETIYDELHRAVRVGDLKSVEDCDDMQFDVECYLAGKM